MVLHHIIIGLDFIRNEKNNHIKYLSLANDAVFYLSCNRNETKILDNRDSVLVLKLPLYYILKHLLDLKDLIRMLK